MITAKSLSEIRSWTGRWRASGQRVALVPTMGNLHDGHIALCERAKRLADRVVVSVYVNPLQFGQNEDFDRYPRTPEQDQRKLIAAGVDLLFSPDQAVMYPVGVEQAARIELPGVSNELCGAFRPGHFVGVATVVTKLFNLVRPDISLFGEKDYQQLFIIRRLIKDLYLPVQVESFPTVREESGLAMSSRNQYLSQSEREIAPSLYRILNELVNAVLEGARDWPALEAQGLQKLEASGFTPEYLSFRNQSHLTVPAGADTELVLLVAARLGQTRLIDNIPFSLSS